MAFEKFALDPNDFSGVSRLFPLPNLVMFPHILQPLHIFEPRYRELMEDALATDKLITMALLSSDSEISSPSPAIEPIACLGRIVSHERLDDGGFNLLLMGLGRVKILSELPPTRRYRTANVDLIVEKKEKQTLASENLRKQLTDLFEKIMEQFLPTTEQLKEVLASKVSLGTLTDVIGYSLNLPLAFKQELLSELNVQRRARRLMEEMNLLADSVLPDSFSKTESPDDGPDETPKGFPPPFSDN
jgi:Lon protease-like protein